MRGCGGRLCGGKIGKHAFQSMRRNRDLRPIPAESFRDWWAKREKQA